EPADDELLLFGGNALEGSVVTLLGLTAQELFDRRRRRIWNALLHFFSPRAPTRVADLVAQSIHERVLQIGEKAAARFALEAAEVFERAGDHFLCDVFGREQIPGMRWETASSPSRQLRPEPIADRTECLLAPRRGFVDESARRLRRRRVGHRRTFRCWH